MKVKRLKKITINGETFSIKWTKNEAGGSFNYFTQSIMIGTMIPQEPVIFGILCHEIMEIVALEMHVRLSRPDCPSDYIFVYDHRQHDSIMGMFSGIISKFI